MTEASYTTPSSTCVHVFISGKLGLKPISAKILGLKFEEAKSITRPDRAAKKKSHFTGDSVLQTSSHVLVSGIIEGIVWHVFMVRWHVKRHNRREINIF